MKIKKCHYCDSTQNILYGYPLMCQDCKDAVDEQKWRRIINESYQKEKETIRYEQP